MILDFKNIEYLKFGNVKQRDAYTELKRLKIFENLKNYHPILAGSIPIEIDLPESDLDIICECNNHQDFSEVLTKLFENKKGFGINFKIFNGKKATIAKFESNGFAIEIFGQNIPTDQQNAYRHMLAEYKILNNKGLEFKNEIKELKAKGIKTEPAFAKLLGLKGDPYLELLKVKV